MTANKPKSNYVSVVSSTTHRQTDRRTDVVQHSLTRLTRLQLLSLSSPSLRPFTCSPSLRPVTCCWSDDGDDSDVGWSFTVDDLLLPTTAVVARASDSPPASSSSSSSPAQLLARVVAVAVVLGWVVWWTTFGWCFLDTHRVYNSTGRLDHCWTSSLQYATTTRVRLSTQIDLIIVGPAPSSMLLPLE